MGGPVLRPARRGAPWSRSCVVPRPRRRRRVGPAGRGARCRSPRSTSPRGRRPPPTSASSTGCSRAGWCPGSVTVLGRRARHRQVHAAAPGAGRAGQGGPALPLRHRRGVGPAGAPPGRAARRAAAAPVARVRHRAARTCSTTSSRSAPTSWPSTRSRPCSTPTLSLGAGSVAQVRECAHRLVRASKERAMSVGARRPRHQGRRRSPGPRVLEHLVDTVLSFEGERHHALRLLRAVKHRFGATDELGLFEMTDAGLASVPDPSALFLADRRPGTPGSVVAPVLDGHRPLLVEVQALVGALGHPHARAARRRASTAVGSRSWSPCSSSTCSMPFAEPRRAHRGRRRGEGRRARRRPRPGARPRVRATGRRRCPPTSSPAARSASAASCARCTRPPAGSPRRRGSGFRRAVVPASAPLEPARHRGAPRRARSTRPCGSSAPTTSRDRRAVLTAPRGRATDDR